MKRNGFDREMCGDYFQYVRPFSRNSVALSSRLVTAPSPGTAFTNADLSTRAYRDCKKNWVS